MKAVEDRPDVPRHIVVEGPIGVGKTSLARRLAESLGGELLLERAEENPFLKRFYENPRSAALSTQLYFLLQRARQMEELRQTDLFTPVRVADFLLDKDRLFAEVVLDAEEFQLYEQVYATLAVETPQPDLVIYLQAPAEVLLARVQKRGHDYERYIELDYLKRLMEAYTRFFYYYNDAPLLIVNATAIDLVNNQDDYAQLLARIRECRSGRHYFNPAPFDA
jgi:deoxyadenosine/deoxycytidine kinase